MRERVGDILYISHTDRYDPAPHNECLALCGFRFIYPFKDYPGKREETIEDYADPESALRFGPGRGAIWRPRGRGFIMSQN